MIHKGIPPGSRSQPIFSGGGKSQVKVMALGQNSKNPIGSSIFW